MSDRRNEDKKGASNQTVGNTSRWEIGGSEQEPLNRLMETRSRAATVYEHKNQNVTKQNSGRRKNRRCKTDEGDGERSLKQREGEGESIPNPED